MGLGVGYSVVPMPTVLSKLHILSLAKDLKQNKPFLKSLAQGKNPHRKRSILKSASNRQLKLLQRLICSFIRGDISISAQQHKRLKKSKKYNFVVKHFTKLNTKQNLRQSLLHINPLLPLFIKVLLKKPR